VTAVEIKTLSVSYLRTLFAWYSEYLSQVGSGGAMSAIFIKPKAVAHSQASSTTDHFPRFGEYNVRIVTDIQDDYYDEYAGEWTDALVDALEHMK
jgi:hypothetical protein